MASTEAGLSKELREDLQHIYNPIHVYLLPDMRMTKKKPYDFEVLKSGIFFGIECKLCRGDTFNYKNQVKSHQPECLRNVIACGGIGMFAIGFVGRKKTVLIKPTELEYMLEKYSNDGDALKFSIFDEHPNLCTIIRRRKIDGKTRWEVEKLIGVYGDSKRIRSK